MEHRIRRATLDDLEMLRQLWTPIGFDVADLEKRLTEFQMVESADGIFLGAIGFQIANGQGLLHHETYADLSAAESLRPSFWKKIQIIAANHGVLRVWIRENAPGWSGFGFQAAGEEVLAKLPQKWDRVAPGWLTVQLKNEDAIQKLEREMAMFMTVEKARSQKIVEGARTFRVIATVVGFIVAFLIFIAAGWLLLRHRISVSPGP